MSKITKNNNLLIWLVIVLLIALVVVTINLNNTIDDLEDNIKRRNIVINNFVEDAGNPHDMYVNSHTKRVNLNVEYKNYWALWMYSGVE